MAADTATEATTTNKRPPPFANTPLPTRAAYVFAGTHLSGSEAYSNSPVSRQLQCWERELAGMPQR